VLSTRKRKDADEAEIKVQVCLFAFDILYLNGEPLLKKPLGERRRLLRESFREVEGTFAFATSRDVSDTEEILSFLNEAVAASCEGLMVKTLEAGGATYEPDKRSHKWLKVKKDYIAGMTDSLDLVPIGAFHGRGKRTGVYGAYLLACYNDETEDYETVREPPLIGPTHDLHPLAPVRNLTCERSGSHPELFMSRVKPRAVLYGDYRR
jgi:DNA ligase-1